MIFVTNDDGIHAPGLRTLITVAREFGEVVVVAPDKPQSGMSHAVTTANPLRIKELHHAEGYREYSCNGTPADAVKIGEKVIMGKKPDLILSGINHGSNAGINLFYSGTMAAAMEGAMSDIPSIGFSLLDYSMEADFSPAVPYMRKIIGQVLVEGMESFTCLNVNIPALPPERIKGIKVCRMGRGFWDEELEKRVDPQYRTYYWLAGRFVSLDPGKDTDEWALSNDFVSVVPIHIDLTAYSSLEKLKNLENHVE